MARAFRVHGRASKAAGGKPSVLRHWDWVVLQGAHWSQHSLSGELANITPDLTFAASMNVGQLKVPGLTMVAYSLTLLTEAHVRKVCLKCTTASHLRAGFLRPVEPKRGRTYRTKP